MKEQQKVKNYSLEEGNRKFRADFLQTPFNLLNKTKTCSPTPRYDHV